MEAIAIKLLSFLLAIGVLVSVHEYGHFWVARRLGIKVLRFSIGFGKPLWRRTGERDNTEYVVAAVPLGGYVKMLDEREGPVPADEAHRAFNRQSLAVRAAVVSAGPAANFLFAILAFWLVLMLGETGLRPLIGGVTPDSLAEQAGFRPGDEILQVAGRETPTWGLAVQELAASSLDDGDLVIQVRTTDGFVQQRSFAASSLGDLAEVDDLVAFVGFEPERPKVPPVFGELLPGERAEAAGIRSGDRIVSADAQVIEDWSAWVEYVRARPEQAIELQLQRDRETLALTLVPARVELGGREMGRIGASNQPVEGLMERYRVEYSLGPLDAAVSAVARTAEFSLLTLKVVWRILTGEASIKNLSGPFTIADAAGKTASYGLVYFLKFLAVVSISLGVLNLLPIPVLDGGHLMFLAVEWVRGGPVPEDWLIAGQKLGLLMLALLMSLAFYVDIHRFFG